MTPHVDRDAQTWIRSEDSSAGMPTTDAAVRGVRFRRLMWIAMILLCVIGAAAVIRRMTALKNPPQNAPPQLASLDAAFAERPILTLAHIAPGLLLMALIPFQFSHSFRNRHLRTHRWITGTILILGLIIGLSAIPMSRHPIGGALELSAIYLFDAFFLLSLARAFLYLRRGENGPHREWMIRAMSIALGVATTRPIMGIFFATSRLTGLTPRDFFGIAFWIGFTLTYIAGELWIRYTRPRPQNAQNTKQARYGDPIRSSS